MPQAVIPNGEGLPSPLSGGPCPLALCLLTAFCRVKRIKPLAPFGPSCATWEAPRTSRLPQLLPWLRACARGLLAGYPQSCLWPSSRGPDHSLGASVHFPDCSAGDLGMVPKPGGGLTFPVRNWGSRWVGFVFLYGRNSAAGPGEGSVLCNF